MAGLAWSDDPDSYAGGSVATGRAFLAEHFSIISKCMQLILFRTEFHIPS
jgi:hypothetical protein